MRIRENPEKRSVKRALTKVQLEAIEIIGSHRKTHVKVGRQISLKTFNSLKRKGLVMWLSEDERTVMLTYPGERVWTALHPHSKWRVR